MTLVAIGACYFDTILTSVSALLYHKLFSDLTFIRVPHYPSEDEKLRASTIDRRRGGNCPNTLEVLVQLVPHGPSNDESSLNLNLITVLPSRSSVASQLIKTALGDQVQLGNCIYREQFNEPASSYIIKSQNTGSRTIVNHNELPDMTLEEFLIAVENLRKTSGQPWFHFEVCSIYTGWPSSISIGHIEC